MHLLPPASLISFAHPACATFTDHHRHAVSGHSSAYMNTYKTRLMDSQSQAYHQCLTMESKTLIMAYTALDSAPMSIPSSAMNRADSRPCMVHQQHIRNLIDIHRHIPHPITKQVSEQVFHIRTTAQLTSVERHVPPIQGPLSHQARSLVHSKQSMRLPSDSDLSYSSKHSPSLAKENTHLQQEPAVPWGTPNPRSPHQEPLHEPTCSALPCPCQHSGIQSRPCPQKKQVSTAPVNHHPTIALSHRQPNLTAPYENPPRGSRKYDSAFVTDCSGLASGAGRIRTTSCSGITN